MSRCRVLVSLLASISFLSASVWAASSAPLGTVTAAQHAYVGTGSASVGTTVFPGDKVSTDQVGSMQVRAGAARLLLTATSTASLDSADGSASARLLGGTALFSTAYAKSFTLYASKAAIRANTDAPTIGQVSLLGARELLVRAKRGSLTVTVDGESKTIEEGESYRIVVDPTPEEVAATPDQGPGGGGRPPVRAGRSRALYFYAAGVAAATGVAVYFALQSPDRP